MIAAVISRYGRRVVSFEEVARIAAGLPDVTENESRGNRSWHVAGQKAFAWERPFSKADVKRFGDQTPPEGPILAIRTEDLNEKEALLAAHPGSFFTIPHFDGYAAVLIQLDKISAALLREALTDGWLATAPPALAAQHFGTR
jgi:hypothetical protein